MKNAARDSKRLLYSLISSALGIAGLAELGAGLWLTFAGAIDDATKALGAGLVLLLAASLDRFESLKGLWMEVKLRKTIDEAEVLLERLRDLSELTGRTLVRLASRDGRVGQGASPRESYELAQEVKQILESVGAERPAVYAAMAPWAHWTLFDMAMRVQGTIRASLDSVLKQPLPAGQDKNATAEHRTRMLELRDSLRLDQQIGGPLDGFAARARSDLSHARLVLPRDQADELQNRLSPWIDEMEYTAEHLSLREPEKWFSALAGWGQTNTP